ncbi:AAA family ATPase [Brevibacillus humidisoli]|uniref:McrB family protein n=1 Tax=Brevibacillus humidisoli TaxID=2895522 RepID=UPI001E35E3BB|nr:AAA family ATPase [Brevibacillus humidisoli]UFJ40743.1 AAA family ATPase [Brevibacillus humidisoli]
MFNKMWEIDLLGVLADDETVQQQLGRPKAVFVNRLGYVQFYIRLITNKPASFPRVDLFTCYSTDLEKYGFDDDLKKTNEEREEDLKDFLQESLLILQPYRKISSNDDHFLAKNVRLIPKRESFRETDTFIPIPVFSPEVHNIDYDELLLRLMKGKYLGRIENISHDQDDTPTIILWREEKSRYKMLGEFVDHSYAHGGFSMVTENGLKERDFTDEWLDASYLDDASANTLMFVNTETYLTMEQALRETDPIQTSSIQEQAPVPEEKPAAPLAQIQVEEESDPVVEEEKKSDEELFMEHFIQVTKEMGLSYREKDLYNFHTAMKSGYLTILAGMSGTGKSRLVQAYGKALGLDQQLVIIPVSPSWTDDSDLIGYVDTMNMLYRPGNTGLINVLHEAQKNSNNLYIVCFDEMNLARVEHYFAKFLSVLEMEPGRRKLKLYDENTLLYNSSQVEQEINIGNNVIFVGTVNLDESTYHFSDKVLDRANVIKLEVQDFEALRHVSQKDAKDKAKTEKKQPTYYNYEQYNQFRNPDGAFTLTPEETALLWELHQTLQQVNKNLGVGPRVARHIDHYLKNLPPSPHLDRAAAFDLQLVQRVFTKLRGPEGLLKELIGTIDSNDEWKNSRLLTILDNYSTVSQFVETKSVLTQKAKELKVNGYTV